MEYKGERNYYKLFANFLFKIFLFCKRNYCIIRYYLAIVIVLLRYCITNDENSICAVGASESLRGVYLFVIGF